MAVETIRTRRTMSARDMADRLGVSPRTVQRIISEPRDEYEQRIRSRQDEALRLRESGMKWADVGAELGGVSASAAYRLAAKAKARRVQSVA